MKFDQFAALLLFITLGCSTQSSFPWQDTSFSDAQVAAGEKMIMLDFYTDT